MTTAMNVFVANGEREVQEIAEAGNAVAREWLEKIQTASDTLSKLAVFGEMRVALQHDTRPEAIGLQVFLFPNDVRG